MDKVPESKLRAMCFPSCWLNVTASVSASESHWQGLWQLVTELTAQMHQCQFLIGIPRYRRSNSWALSKNFVLRSERGAEGHVYYVIHLFNQTTANTIQLFVPTIISLTSSNSHNSETPRTKRDSVINNLEENYKTYQNG